MEDIIKNALRKNSFSISSVIFERIIILYHKRKLILQLVPISSVDEKGIKFKHAYTGNLTRQEVTAQHVLKYSNNKGTKITTTTKLREGGYGSFEGDSIAADNQKIANVYGYQDGKEFQQATGKDYWNKLQNAYYKLDSENSQNTNLAKSDRTESAKQVQKRMSSELLHIAKTMQSKAVTTCWWSARGCRSTNISQQ